jgi:hypothetical protein
MYIGKLTYICGFSHLLGFWKVFLSDLGNYACCWQQETAALGKTSVWSGVILVCVLLKPTLDIFVNKVYNVIMRKYQILSNINNFSIQKSL